MLFGVTEKECLLFQDVNIGCCFREYDSYYEHNQGVVEDDVTINFETYISECFNVAMNVITHWINK